MAGDRRPDFDTYFMNLAAAVARRANCENPARGRRNHVGAVLVLGERVISTGYNGTPTGMMNCDEGGCYRCRSNFESGTYYDICVCVHAEENALLAAARFGIAVEGATVYTTLSPCFSCAKALLQAGVREVVFKEKWSHPRDDASLQRQYEELLEMFKSVRQHPDPGTTSDANAA